MKRRWLVISGIVLLALLLVGGREDMPAGTTYSTRPAGAQAIFELFEKTELKPKRYRYPYSKLEPSVNQILFVVSPDDMGSAHELVEWVKRGNTLVYFASHKLSEDPLASELGINFKNPENFYQELSALQMREASFHCPESQREICAGVKRVSDNSFGGFIPNSEWEVVRGSNELPTGVTRKLGKGNVWLFSDQSMISNQYVDRVDNLRLIYQIASASSGVFFDEFHHGYLAPAEAKASESLTSIIIFACYLGLFLLVIALARGLRFGPPIPESMIPSAAGTDFIAALGLLYADNNASSVLQRYLGQWQKRLERTKQIRPQTSIEATMDNLQARGDISTAERTILLQSIDRLAHSDTTDHKEMEQTIINLEDLVKRSQR